VSLGRPVPASAVKHPCDGLQLNLDVFDGPFDLLVTLILRDEVDLWEVRVSRIVADYILKLADSDEFDLEATSYFIVLVASLLELKSQRLLAEGVLSSEEDELLGEEEAGEELLAALLRYSQFKRVAENLGERYAAHSRRIYRHLPVAEEFLHQQAPVAARPAYELTAALEVLLREPPVPDVSHITDLAVSLVNELRRLRDLLVRDGGFTFSSVAPRDRLEKAVTFFALLELHNRGEATLRQARPFAEIVVERSAVDGALPADDALASVG
jgi:segregation and condensation protein A